MPEPYRFYDAPFWRDQPAAFAQQGVDAWRLKQPIPDLGTSNPQMAMHCAAFVTATLTDWALLYPDDARPFYLVDLGAGVGRFAFNFLTAFTVIKADAELTLPPLRYIVTEFVEETLDFAQQHPLLQTFIEQGLLDFAYFDALTSTSLHLRVSGERIEAGQLKTPLIVMANYLFSALPSDLFYITQGLVHDVLFRENARFAADEAMQLDLGATQHEPNLRPYPDQPVLTELLELYRTTFMQTHISVPIAAIDCLRRLEKLSEAGFVLLSVDGGSAQAEDLRGQPLPEVVAYADTFYSRVNFHALLAVFQKDGARPLTTGHRHDELTSIALLAVDEAQRFTQTERAFIEHFVDYGPDDIFELAVIVEQQIERMSIEQILAALRTSRYNPRLFRLSTPRLVTLLRDYRGVYTRQIADLLPRIKAMGFSLGPQDNILYSLAAVYFELGLLPEARDHYIAALNAGVIHEDVYYGLAVTLVLLNEPEMATSALENVLLLNPVHPQAAQMLLALSNLQQ